MTDTIPRTEQQTTTTTTTVKTTGQPSLTSASTTDGGAPKLTSVERVTSIPVVNDSLNRTHELLQSNGLTARAYGLAENIVKTGYGYAQPVLGYGKPYIKSADGLANKGLDMVESRFPYPFQTKTDQIVADAKKPADQAFSVARGIYDNQPIVQKAVDSIYVINQQLSATVSGSKKMASDLAGDAGAKISALQNALLEELGNLKAQGTALPGMIQHNIGQAYNDLSTILLNHDKSISERGGDMAHYVTETLQPILDKVLEIARATKETAEQKAGEAGIDVDGTKQTVSDTADEAKGIAKEAKDSAKAKGQQTAEYASEKSQQARGYAADKTQQAGDYTQRKGEQAAGISKEAGNQAANVSMRAGHKANEMSNRAADKL